MDISPLLHLRVSAQVNPRKHTIKRTHTHARINSEPPLRGFARKGESTSKPLSDMALWLFKTNGLNRVRLVSPRTVWTMLASLGACHLVMCCYVACMTCGEVWRGLVRCSLMNCRPWWLQTAVRNTKKWIAVSGILLQPVKLFQALCVSRKQWPYSVDAIIFIPHRVRGGRLMTKSQLEKINAWSWRCVNCCTVVIVTTHTHKLSLTMFSKFFRYYSNE